MPCFRTLKGYRSKALNPTGKRSITFDKKEALHLDAVVTLPCQQCRFCRLEHSRNWAVRATHEASLYENNCFLTLTYDDQHLPRYGSLDYSAPVAFMKALRQKFGKDIRSFGCAEYGEKLSRPHYHICLFNFNFDDRKLWKNDEENRLYLSKDLQALWPQGHSTIGELTFESAAYVARYVTKKITGERAQNHYERIDPRNGEVLTKLPERSIAVSRMPGLGKPWFDQNLNFLLHHDFVVCRGKKVRPPKYYDRLMEKLHPEAFAKIKEKRREAGEQASEILIAEDHAAMSAYNQRHDAWTHGVPTPEPRLYVMEEVQERKFELLKRGLENG